MSPLPQLSCIRFQTCPPFRTHSSSQDGAIGRDGGLNAIRWTDISNVDQPGTYLLPNDTRIKIDAKHIVMWTHDPDGVFDAFRIRATKRAAEYTLTDFHPSEDLVG